MRSGAPALAFIIMDDQNGQNQGSQSRGCGGPHRRGDVLRDSHPRREARRHRRNRAQLFRSRLSSAKVDLKSYQGQVVLVNFWATWCPPCVEETPSLVDFADKLKSSGVVVLGISVDDNASALHHFVQANHISYPIGRDPDRALAAHYGTYQFPETYILDRHGKLAEKIIGPTDSERPTATKLCARVSPRANRFRANRSVFTRRKTQPPSRKTGS